MNQRHSASSTVPPKIIQQAVVFRMHLAVSKKREASTSCVSFTYTIHQSHTSIQNRRTPKFSPGKLIDEEKWHDENTCDWRRFPSIRCRDSFSCQNPNSLVPFCSIPFEMRRKKSDRSTDLHLFNISFTSILMRQESRNRLFCLQLSNLLSRKPNACRICQVEVENENTTPVSLHRQIKDLQRHWKRPVRVNTVRNQRVVLAKVQVNELNRRKRRVNGITTVAIYWHLPARWCCADARRAEPNVKLLDSQKSVMLCTCFSTNAIAKFTVLCTFYKTIYCTLVKSCSSFKTRTMLLKVAPLQTLNCCPFSLHWNPAEHLSPEVEKNIVRRTANDALAAVQSDSYRCKREARWFAVESFIRRSLSKLLDWRYCSLSWK